MYAISRLFFLIYSAMMQFILMGKKTNTVGCLCSYYYKWPSLRNIIFILFNDINYLFLLSLYCDFTVKHCCCFKNI